MKAKILMTVFIVSALLMSCEKFDDDSALVDSAIKDAFDQLFPSAKRVDWDVDNSFYIADFKRDKETGSAWFVGNGSATGVDAWLMTEWDITYNSLPQAVKDAFKASEYGSWRVDDVDKVERMNVEVVYVIEAENGEREVVMRFSADGVLLSAVLDVENGGDNTSMIIDQTAMAAVDVTKTFISTRYPEARILDIEVEHGYIEIDIVDGNRHKDVKFDLSGEWLLTEYDVAVSELPEAVTLAITSSSYSDYRIDDVDFIEASAGNHYVVELEKGEREVTLKISATGEVL